MIDKYYTKEGIEALNIRLSELVKLYINNINYPAIFRIYGFPMLKIHSKSHHEGMIDELTQLLNKNNVEVEVR